MQMAFRHVLVRKSSLTQQTQASLLTLKTKGENVAKVTHYNINDDFFKKMPNESLVLVVSLVQNISFTLLFPFLPSLSCSPPTFRSPVLSLLALLPLPSALLLTPSPCPSPGACAVH